MANLKTVAIECHCQTKIWSDHSQSIIIISSICNIMATIEDFELGAYLGSGAFGSVSVAREKSSKFIVAIKVLIKSRLIETEQEKSVVREIEIQTKLR